MGASSKKAVVLLNLGGPLQEADIRPFLFNFFRDKYIFGVPEPLRTALAFLVSWHRSRHAARESYGRLGGKSPLLENTVAQARALEKELQRDNPDVRVFVSMRHWHPLADEVVKEVAAFAPDEIILLPLYPQYSTTTTLSALEDWRRAAKKAGLKAPTREICCYPANEGFVSASAALVQAELKKAPRRARILFSAHGLPEKVVAGGDSYQHQCEETASAIVQQLGILNLDWQMCYQSRLGPLKWIGPSIEEALQKAADDGVAAIVYPLSFVSEHVETLVELDEEYHARAKAMGLAYVRVPTVSTHPSFIAGLRDIVFKASPEVKRICPAQFCKCYQEVKHG